MILNKFRHIYRGRSAALILLFFAINLFSCKKTANINSNKAYVNVTHTAYKTGPVTLNFDGVPLFADPLAFGETTGNSASPYDTTTAGVHDMQVLLNDTVIISGNTALQQGAHYSMFVYDTLNTRTISVIIFQNSHGAGTDTTSYIRFLNFTPGSSIGIKVVYPRDTTGKIKASYRDTVNIGPGNVPSNFVGYNPNPTIYGFTGVHIGKNDIYAFFDSSRPYRDPVDPSKDSSNFIRMGSLQFDSTRNYNVYLQGFPFTTGADSFQVKSVLIN
jgi:Domain of unknown function (DUF4397)